MKNLKAVLFVFAMVIIILTAVKCKSASTDDISLIEKGFINPPEEARPRVWWHWMNGNISQEGIRADLQWMHRIGLAGFQNFDAALATPQIVDKRLAYMTPEWKDAFRLATKLADSLGLEMAIAGSPGWSESGGPWVKPEQAMKKYVWSETRVEGGKPFNGTLPKPPSTTGTFQNLSMASRFSVAAEDRAPIPEFYADAAVVAFRLPETDISMTELNPLVTSSGGKFNLAALTDGDLANSTFLPYARPGEISWIQYYFSEPVTVQALTIVGGGNPGMFGFGADASGRTLETSEDGKNFSKVTDIVTGGVNQKTLSFNPVTSKYFRFTWKAPGPSPFYGTDPGDLGEMFGINAAMLRGPKGTEVAELVLHTVKRINRFEEKAAFATATDLYTALTPEIDPKDAVNKNEVIDLTSMMKADGTLDWTPPEGKWAIIRLGYSLTGHQNSPASPEATGLEVDKLSEEHVRSYFTNYLDQYKDATGGLMGKKGLRYIITDSWEAGTQNWTDNMIEEFRNRRGYDLIPWIPVLTGHIVESSGSSERFLWDFRKTIGDLTTVNHYDNLTEILKERGIARYSESHESGRAFVGDGMEVKKNAAVPMSATWTPGGFDPGTEVATRYKADVRESASVSHIYGQKYVAAESLTAIMNAWSYSPEKLKPTADMEMANGLNRFVIHCSPHQPVNDKIPGLGLGPFGQWFTRHETWAEQAGVWIDYLARSSWILQQGEFIADIAWYYGEDNNITALYHHKLPDVPEGYNYDFVNADALVNVLGTEKGKITTPAGTTYRLLVLDANARYMTLPVLKKIDDLVNAGAIIAGDKPLATPSLSDDASEFKSITDRLWANEKGENKIGKGKILAGMTAGEALDAIKISPDFSYSKPQDDTKLLFVHRKAGNADFYWVNNRKASAQDLEAEFRVSGKEVEIWHPETGRIEKVSYTIGEGSTKVPLHLEAEDAVFVVFRNKAKKASFTLPSATETQIASIDGPWTVKFQEKRGAPAETIFESLIAWNENTDKGIKYFSGIGTYLKTLTAPADWFNKGSELWLDLGSVKNLAEVIVNGQSLGIVWKTPFRVNVSEVLKEGDNSIEIRVTNLWVNRLIGDQQPDAGEKITYTTMRFYAADSPLLPSGLIGPVTLVRKSNEL